jgi:hypothetical protein
VLTIFDVTGRQHPKFRFDRHVRGLLGFTPRQLREFVTNGFGRLPSGCVFRFEERAQKDILERVRTAIPGDVAGIRELIRSHADASWDLQRFLDETDLELIDIYRSKRSWTSLRADVGVAPRPPASQVNPLENVQKLLHVTDDLRLRVWERLLDLDLPGSTLEQRAAGMLFAVLYGREASKLEAAFERWSTEPDVREEIRNLLPVLRSRKDHLPHTATLTSDVPLLMHGQYLDIELSAAFHAVTQREGYYRNFYTGVENVGNGRYDLLLVNLAKGGKEDHLKYQDFPLSETVFQWQSKSGTMQDDTEGRRHLHGHDEGVSSLLFVRETQKDSRGVTCAFRYLGPVMPRAFHGERPITVEWVLKTPLRPEWVRRWSNVS